MTARRTIFLTTIAGLAVLAAGTAAARSGPGGQESTRAAATQSAAAMFAQLDVNSDGRLDAADRSARHDQRFAALDADGSGAIEPAEFAAMRAERGSVRHHGSDRPGQGRKHLRAGMVDMADTNRDGSITESEFTAGIMARFDQADADGDGTISADERAAQRSAMRERMQQWRDTRAAAKDAAP